MTQLPWLLAACLACALTLLGGCADDDDTPPVEDAGTGGTVSSGGSTATGGQPATGGGGGTSGTGGTTPDASTDEDSGMDEDAGMGEDAGTFPELCDLPFEVGLCDAAIRVYWFNPETGSCEEQLYGGCDGNENRFDTLESCIDTCSGPDTLSCEEDSDCAWGEIDHEIVEPEDCICLLGCPYLPFNKETIDRRNEQHQALCDPQFDGNGDPCPIDDCIELPTAMCVDGQCTGDISAR